MNATTTDHSRFCSACARRAGLDAAGSAYAYSHVLALEAPLPWPIAMYSEPGVLPRELIDLRQMQVEAYARGEPMQVGALAIAPDRDYSVPGYRRVISYRRPDAAFAAFTQHEYLVPAADVGPLCWALLVDQAALPRFGAAVQPPSGARDLMVCTHGAVDAACALFGFPLYRQLRHMAGESQGRLRVWRVSHFGGHVFAPTLLDMPEFRYWGFVGPGEAELLATRAGDGERLRAHHRGWAGFDSPLLQVAEGELFARHGWAWAGYLKSGQVLCQDESAEPAWAEVRIAYAAPDGSARGAYTARVELDRYVECITSTGDTAPYRYPQYRVARLERTAEE